MPVMWLSGEDMDASKSLFSGGCIMYMDYGGLYTLMKGYIQFRDLAKGVQS